MLEKPIRTVASNRKALHDYFITEKMEAGVALTGTEIKSVRAGQVSLQDSFAKIESGELWMYNVHIAPYAYGNRENVSPVRRRKLLMHREEIRRLDRKVREKGFTLVPLRVYLKGNRAKVELAVARGKRLYDKREAIAERDASREIARAMRQRTR
ncbi:MAG: SsrA-binding protein SmpB [Chloroflexota bacterium]